MESYNLRALNINDFKEIEDLVLNRKRFLDKPVNRDVNLKYLGALKSMLLSFPDQFQLKGCFSALDNKLHCFAGAFQHSGTPTWSLIYVTNAQGHSQHQSPLSSVLKSHLEYFEEKNFYRFIYAAPIRGLSVYKADSFSSLLTRICPYMQRYQFYSIEKIKSGEMPSFELHQKLLGKTPAQVDMVIRCAELKENYRRIF